jgi:hypothetical protein
MMLAAANPNDTGPIVINGASISYRGGAWSEDAGDNPMRYSGGTPAGLQLGGQRLRVDRGDQDARPGHRRPAARERGAPWWSMSHANPFLWWLGPAAGAVCEQRKGWIRTRHGALLSASLDHYRALRDAGSEAAFCLIYGNLFSLYLDGQAPKPPAGGEGADSREMPYVAEALGTLPVPLASAAERARLLSLLGRLTADPRMKALSHTHRSRTRCWAAAAAQAVELARTGCWRRISKLGT